MSDSRPALLGGGAHERLVAMPHLRRYCPTEDARSTSLVPTVADCVLGINVGGSPCPRLDSRGVRVSACIQPSKIRYADQAAAVRALDEIRVKKPWSTLNLAPYKCGHHWHLGHHQAGMKFQRARRVKGR